MTIFGKHGVVRSLLGENHVYEYYGDRFRILIGNIERWNENETGARDGAGIAVIVDVYNHFGEFDRNRKQYLSHGFSVMMWRYGVLVTWRGREIDDEWDRPRWQLERDGTVKEDWR